MRRTLGRAALRTVWLLVGAAIGLAAVLLLVGLARVVGGPPGLVVPLCLLPALLIGLLPGVRELEVTAARSLLGVSGDLVVPVQPRAAHRLRTTLLVVLHLALGLLTAVLLVGLAPGVVLLVAAALRRRPLSVAGTEVPAQPAALALLLGLLALAGCLAAAAGLGRLAAACAEPLLGPTAGDRLEVALGRLAAESRHVRLARDLHDGIGHALTIISVQAEAGRRTLARDPEGTDAALGRISATARQALGELDDMLALLRDRDRDPRLEPDLASLPALLATHRAAGLEVRTDQDLPEHLPGLVSTTAYRIVAEGLANAQRHAGPGPVHLDLRRDGDRLAVVVTNPLGPAGSRGRAPRSGRGLTGIGERVDLFGGTVTAGPEASQWVLRAEIPLGGDRG